MAVRSPKAAYSKRKRDDFKSKLSTASGEELERLKQIKAEENDRAKIRMRNMRERTKMRVAAYTRMLRAPRAVTL